MNCFRHYLLKIIAIFVLNFDSALVFASLDKPAETLTTITIPCKQVAWDWGARALFLNINVNGTSVGPLRSIETKSTSSNHVLPLGQTTGWGWGYMVEGSYHFNTGNDITANWYHLSNGFFNIFNGSTTLPGDYTSVSGITDLSSKTSDITIFNQMKAKIQPTWDAINVELGQTVNLKESKYFRFHGGVQYARLTSFAQMDIIGSVLKEKATPPINTTIVTNPTYNGIGPRLGADMTWSEPYGISLYAKGAGSLLAGYLKYTTQRLETSTGYLYNFFASNSLITPELEAKLGASYTQHMTQGNFTFDMGWMWQNYFNVIPSTTSNTLDNPLLSNISFQGLYFGMNWIGYVT